MTTSMRSDREHWRDYLDINADHYVLAGIYNAVNNNTRATGHWAKGKAPKIDPWPIPQLAAGVRAKAEARKPKSVADLFTRVQSHKQRG